MVKSVTEKFLNVSRVKEQTQESFNNLQQKSKEERRESIAFFGEIRYNYRAVT